MIALILIAMVFLSLTTTTEAKSLVKRIKTLKDGLKKLQGEKTRCSKYCNKNYHGCKFIAKISDENKICDKAIIICHFACTNPANQNKRNLLKEMSRLVPAKKS